MDIIVWFLCKTGCIMAICFHHPKYQIDLYSNYQCHPNIHEKSFLHVVSSMEDLGRRFPLISQIILNNVDDKSLTKFRKASRENSNFLENERFYWIRRIKRYFSNFEEFQESWKKVIKKTPVDFLKDLAIDVHSFFQGLIK